MAAQNEVRKLQKNRRHRCIRKRFGYKVQQ